MKGPGPAVGAQPAVIGHPIGGVGILLHLRDEDALADGMEGARFDEKHVPLVNGNKIADLGYRSLFDMLPELLPGQPRVQPINQPGTGLAV